MSKKNFNDSIWDRTSNLTKNISWGVKAAGAYDWQPYHLHVLTVLKSGSLNLLEPSGPVQACNGIAFCTICWRWSERPCSLRHTSIATPLLGLWVQIPQRPWMFVSCECCAFVRQRSLHLVDYLSKRVLPSVVCPSVIAKPHMGRAWPEIRSQHHGGWGGECMCWWIYWLYWIKKGDLLQQCTNFLNVLSHPTAPPPPNKAPKIIPVH